MKKALTFVLAFAMIASMFSFGALAATSDPNFTASQFTYTIGISSSSVDVYVGPADSDYQLSGYDNLTDANNAVITPDITIGDDIASIGSGTGVLHGGLYLKKYTVTRDDPLLKLESGPVSIRFTAANSSYVDVTVIVESSLISINVFSEVAVLPPDEEFVSVLTEPSDYIVVTPPSLGGYFNGQADVAQTYVSPIVTLYSLTLTSPKFLDAVGLVNYTYVNSITGYTALGLPSDPVEAAGWDGWQYRVYNSDGDIYPDEYANLGAAAFKLNQGDKVFWQYGSYGITFPTTWDDVLDLF